MANIEKITLQNGTSYPVGGAYREEITGNGANGITEYVCDAIDAYTSTGTIELDLSSAGMETTQWTIYKISSEASHFTAEECRYMSGTGFSGTVEVSDGGSLVSVDIPQGTNMYNYGESTLENVFEAFLYFMSQGTAFSIEDTDSVNRPIETTNICHMNTFVSGLIFAMEGGTYTADVLTGGTIVGTLTVTVPSDGIYLLYSPVFANAVTLDSGAVLTVAKYELDNRYVGTKIPTIVLGLEYIEPNNVGADLLLGALLKNVDRILKSHPSAICVKFPDIFIGIWKSIVLNECIQNTVNGVQGDIWGAIVNRAWFNLGEGISNYVIVYGNEDHSLMIDEEILYEPQV